VELCEIKIKALVFEYHFKKPNAFMESMTLLGTILGKMSGTGKWQGTFFAHLVCLFMQVKGRINFVQMGRYGRYNESTYRANFAKAFDFQGFNTELIKAGGSGHYVVAFDPSHIRKSGKHTFGRGKFWSGRDNAMKAGLELGGFAVCDMDNHTALHLEGFQTPSPAGLKAKGQTLLDHCADLWVQQADKLREFSAHGVVDAYFSKYGYVEKICTKTRMHLIPRLRDDADLRYLYQGGVGHEQGRPRQYAGKIDSQKPDENYFELSHQDDKIRVYGAIVHSVALKRKIKLALTQYLDERGKVKTTKPYFCTDTNLSAWFIVKYYQNRFQIEFPYRDANQFTGLEHCQARDEAKLHFHFNTALTTAPVMKAVHYLSLPKEERGAFSMASLKVKYHNELLLQKFFEAFAIPPELHINQPKYRELINFGVFNLKN
jgi:Transposase DDE domain